MKIILLTKCGCRNTVEADARNALPASVYVALGSGIHRIFKRVSDPSYPHNDVYKESEDVHYAQTVQWLHSHPDYLKVLP